MKAIYFILTLICFGLFSSFSTPKACAYAESNMNYIMLQTQKALEQNDIHKIRLYTYRAINALEKSRVKFKDCGCGYATTLVNKNNENLKKAAKVYSLRKAKLFLKKSLDNTIKSIEILEDHELLNNCLNNNDLTSENTKSIKKEKLHLELPGEKSLYAIIDESLVKYEMSLNKIVNTVNCKEARTFANKIYSHCEHQLLIPNLTEGKKYYNLRTKEITAKALKAIGECDKE